MNIFQPVVAQRNIGDQQIAGVLPVNQRFLHGYGAIQNIQDGVAAVSACTQTKTQVALGVQINAQNSSAGKEDSGMIFQGLSLLYNMSINKYR